MTKDHAHNNNTSRNFVNQTYWRATHATPTRQAFWGVVQSELSPEERRLLLLFITGTERLPEAGCETLSIEVSNRSKHYLMGAMPSLAERLDVVVEQLQQRSVLD